MRNEWFHCRFTSIYYIVTETRLQGCDEGINFYNTFLCVVPDSELL